MRIVSVSTDAEAAIAPAMISPWMARLWIRAWIRPWRNWLRYRNPTRSAINPTRLRTTMRRVRLDEARWPIASHTARGQPSGRDRVWAREVRGAASSVWV